MAKSFVFNPFTGNFDEISQITIGTAGSTPNTSGASISADQQLTLQPADGTNPGILSTGAQTIAGDKTFSGAIGASNLSGTNTGDQTITLTGAVTGSGTGSFVTTYALQTTEDIYVDKGRSDTYTETGSVLYPYKTIQAAINAIQAAADNTNSKPYQIVIAAGAYSEALTMSGANLVNIVMTGLGAVTITSLTCTVANTWDVFSVSGVSISTMTCTGASDAGTPWGIGSEFRSCVFGDVTFTNISTAYIKESTIAGNLVVTNVIGSGFQRGQITGTTTVTYDAGAPKPSGISFTFLVLEGALTVGDITVGAGAFVQPRIGCRIGLPGGNVAVAGNFTSYTSFIRASITVASTGTFVNAGSFYDPATLSVAGGGTFTNSTFAEVVRNVPAGNLAATNVQSALNELQTDVDTRATSAALTAHISDATDAHAASAITNTPAGNLAATEVQAALNELQTDVDTRATSAALTAHISDATDAHAASAITNTPSGNLAATEVQAALNELQTDVDTRTAKATLTTKGDLYVATGAGTVVRQGVGTNTQMIVADSAQTNGIKYVNAPQGVKNYIVVNADLEQGSTTGYSLGTATLTNAFPSGAPTFGSGASGNLSLSSISSGQLAGTYSLGYTSSAATTAGNFVATDAFAVDLEGQAKVMQFKIAYSAVTNPTNGNFSGTSSNSFGVAIYDVTNSAWIQPAGVFNIIQNSGVGFATGTFQTSSNGTSYRLVFFNANATSGAITLYLDDFFVGPQAIVAGAAVSDWKSVTITPAAGFGTVTNGVYFARRVGDSLQVRGYFKCGTVAGSAAAFDISGYSVDTAKIQATVKANLGTWETMASGAAYGSGNRVGPVFWNSGTSTFNLSGSGGTDTFGVTNVSSLATTGDGVSFDFSFPVVGWSSNSDQSADTDTRVVAASYYGSAATSITSGAVTFIDFPTKTGDTHGAVLGAGSGHVTTTNTGWRYIVPVTGWYDISAVIVQTATSQSTSQYLVTYLYVNGVQVRSLDATYGNGTGQYFRTSGAVPAYPLNAGDRVEIALLQNIGTITTYNSNEMSVGIRRLSGPATIAASESVTAGYYMSANAGSSTSQPANFDTKLYDSHNAVTASAAGTGTWKFTAPISGVYKFSGPCFLTTGASPNALMYKNGTVFQTAGSIQTNGTFSCGIKLLAGEYVDLRLSSSLTLSGGAAGTSNSSIFIERIGN